MNGVPTPPRFVPTLTEVVYPASASGLPKAVVTHGASMPPVSKPDVLPHQIEEQLLNRIMQRVDLVLERRLREALSQLILTHTQALGSRLREEIELVVRESVSQAMAQERPLPTSAPKSGRSALKE